MEVLLSEPQSALFELGSSWEDEWQGMPEFVQEDLQPVKSLEVRLRSAEELEEFEARAGQVYHGKWLWYPPKKYGKWRDQRYDGPPVLPRYPVYVISKGRWESRMTARALDQLGVPYFIVVEPQERDAYAEVLDPHCVLALPFSNLGQGSIPARNWVWEHALRRGAKRHWILDDNIQGFYRLNRNTKIQTTSGVMFRAAEDFVDRYENVAIAGFQYESFAMRRQKCPPFVLNTRVYSCILIRNDIPYRWRGRYNEDTDLSLRALKDGHVTVLFNAFLANKTATMLMKGGNTDELYRRSDGEDDGRLLMAKSLQEQHPDVTTITWKWGRWQHHVDYSRFERNALRRVPGLEVPRGVNNYGMELTDWKGREEAPPPDLDLLPWQNAPARKWREKKADAEPAPKKERTKKAKPAPPRPRPPVEEMKVVRLPLPPSRALTPEEFEAQKAQMLADMKRSAGATQSQIEVGAAGPPPGWEPDPFPSLDGVKEVAVDFETTGLMWWAGDRPVGTAVSWVDPQTGQLRSAYLPTRHEGGGNHDPDREREWRRTALRGKYVRNLNTKFDLHMSYVDGVDLEEVVAGVGDIAHYAALLDDYRGRRGKHQRPFSLEAISQDYLGEGKVRGLDMSRGAGVLPAHLVTPYARQDAALVVRNLAKMRPKMAEEGLQEVALLEDEVHWVVLEMERNASLMDVEKLRRWAVESEKDLALLDLQIVRDIGFAVNPDVAEDMARLFALCGLTSDSFTDTCPNRECRRKVEGGAAICGKCGTPGRPSYAGAVIERAAQKDPRMAMVLRRARLADLRSKFILPYNATVGDDGLLRYSFHQLRGDEHGTVSGRFSCSQPVRGVGANVQAVFAVENQVKVHGEKYVIRELFIPAPGKLYGSADAMQIEYRVFAHVSESPRLIQAYADDPRVDFHEWTGELVRRFRPDFGRKRLKIFNFLNLFGGGMPAVIKQIGVGRAEALELTGSYHQAFPEAKGTQRRATEVAKTRGHVKTVLGRRARFNPCPKHGTSGTKDPCGSCPRYYAALNRAVSGGAADINKKKMLDVYRERKRIGMTMRMTIHDEVTGDLEDARGAELLQEVLDRQAVPLKVPILWDVRTGKNWAECK